MKTRTLVSSVLVALTIVAWLGSGHTDEPEPEQLSERKTDFLAFRAEVKSSIAEGFQFKSADTFDLAYLCPREKADEILAFSQVFYRDIYARFFAKKLAKPVRLIVFATQADFARATGSDAYGFYSYEKRALVTYANSGAGTFWHELVHAFMHQASAGEVQEWFSEGLASFYEMASIRDGHMVEGYTNWRMPYLRNAMKAKRLPHLRVILRQQDLTGDYGYAAARFLFCYLWTNGVMDEFVKSYLEELAPSKKGRALGDAAIAKLEELLGKDLDTINQEYLKLARKYRGMHKLEALKKH